MNRTYNERYGDTIVWYRDGLAIKITKLNDSEFPTIHCKSHNLVFRDGIPDLCGLAHRDGGLPAVEYPNGHKVWYVNGQLHRDGGLPAIEYVDGGKLWYVDGKCHRDGGLPAAEHTDGHKEWHVNGKRHRDGGLPAVEFANGDKYWYVNGHMIC